MNGSIPAMELDIGPTFPYETPQLDLASGDNSIVDHIVSQACPEGFDFVLRTADYRKHIWKLSGLPTEGALGVDDCDMPYGVWDTVSMLLACPPGSTSCTCYANDDGCGGVGVGDAIYGVQLQSGMDYYYVVAPYQA